MKRSAASWIGRRRTRSPSTIQSPNLPAPLSARTSCCEQIGEGGFGVVFLAEQERPVRRRVAAEDHQAGDGHPAGDRPLRGRAAGAGDDGPSEYRQGARRRDHGKRPAVLRDGAGPGRPDHRVLRPVQSHNARAAGTVHHGLPGGAARPPEGSHPPRHQADQRAGGHAGRPAIAQNHRLRRGQGDQISSSPSTR